MVKKTLFIVLGTISLALGLLGIFTPGLPTTPFILLTGYLYSQSSPKLHQMLKDNKVTGFYLNRVKQGLGIKGCIISIALMWIMVSITAFVVFADDNKKYMMIGLGILGTIAQLIVLGRKSLKLTLFKVPKNRDIQFEKEN